MTSKLSLLWSTLLGLPFLAGGAYVLVWTEFPAWYGAALGAFGLFVVGVGLYIYFVAGPKEPTLREGEELLDERHPTQRVARAFVLVGLPVLGVAWYLLFETFVPYVYPTVTFLVGLYLYTRGVNTYWQNLLTTYYVTNQRIVETYRFLSLSRHEIPIEKVRSVQERKSVSEAMVGLGNIRVTAGGGSTALEIVIRNVDDATEFANEIRNLI